MARLGETGDGAPSVSAVSGFESDLADLIDDHVRACGGDLSFDAFKAHWQSRSFSFVHNARLVELLEGEYAQMLFSTTMPYLAPDAGPTVRRIAALYALHLLYHTQQLAPRARVYVTPRDVRRLAQLVETCVAMGAADAVRAAKELVDDQAFAVGVSDATREEALDDAIAEAEARTRTTSASAARQKKRKTAKDAGSDAARGDGDDDVDRGRVSDDEDENPEALLRARVAAASRGALEHLRATRVPGSFQALAEDSTRYGACMAALTRRGEGHKGNARRGETSGDKSGRAETRTAEMHELVRRQVVKYDEKLRAALRPETTRDASVIGNQSLMVPRDILDMSASAPDAAPGVRADASGSGPDLGSERDPRRLGLAAPAARALQDAPRFGSMPDFANPGRFRGDQREEGNRAGARASRLGSRLEESDGESDGE
jgi:hypothetical protein